MILDRYYKRKIIGLEQNSDHVHRVSSDILPGRHIAFLADQRGWAFHNQAALKAGGLGDGWEADIYFLGDKPVIDPDRYDLLFNFNHTPSEYDRLFHGKLIKGLYSHYHHTANIPWQYVYRMVKHASVLVVANREQAEEIRPYFSNTVELPDGVDTTVFYPGAERTGSEIVAGWSGNPDRRLARKRVKRFYEVVEPACRTAAVPLKTARNLTHDQLREMYNQCDVVLIASRTEGNPISLFEAGACGCTVITTAVGVAPQIIDDGVNGFIIPTGMSDRETTRQMAARLQWCRDNPEATRVMGQRLREKINRERDGAAVGEAFRNLLGTLF